MAANTKTTAKKKPASTRKTTASRKKAPTKKRAGKKPASSASSAKPGRRSPRGENRPVQKLAEQPMMKALRAEHRHMATVMQLFADQLKAIEEGQLVDTHVVYEIMDYMVSWPDRYHHPREDLIYGRVAELDGAAADEVDTLQRDHDRMAVRGRAVLEDIARWREGEVPGTAVVKSGRQYIDHSYEHMNLEEKLVFPHIEAVLSLQDWRELSEDDRLQALAQPVFGPRVQREYRNLTRKLRRRLRRGVERGTMVEWIGIEALMESLEVVSIAYESARDSTAEHARTAWEECLDIIRESPLTAPLQCAANNAKIGIRLLEDIAEISRDTYEDLARVNQERKDRVRLLDR
jgi:hemerythrin-like domain-containing protein